MATRLAVSSFHPRCARHPGRSSWSRSLSQGWPVARPEVCWEAGAARKGSHRASWWAKSSRVVGLSASWPRAWPVVWLSAYPAAGDAEVAVVPGWEGAWAAAELCDPEGGWAVAAASRLECPKRRRNTKWML